MSETKLLPCPFCGSGKVWLVEQLDSDGKGRGFDVSCHTVNCYLADSGHYFQTEALAIEAWNTRTSEARLREAVEALDTLEKMRGECLRIARDQYQRSRQPTWGRIIQLCEKTDA